jgi:hypothetical protein
MPKGSDAADLAGSFYREKKTLLSLYQEKYSFGKCPFTD